MAVAAVDCCRDLAKLDRCSAAHRWSNRRQPDSSTTHRNDMAPISFMHTGDEHIDSDTHGSINAATGRNTAWESNFRALNHLAQTAAERGVDAFISAGDNFKTGRPSM